MSAANPIDRLEARVDETAKRGCRVCGAPSEVAITVQARGVGENKPSNVSQTRSFCADHAAEVWSPLMDAVNREEG